MVGGVTSPTGHHSQQDDARGVSALSGCLTTSGVLVRRKLPTPNKTSRLRHLNFRVKPVDRNEAGVLQDQLLRTHTYRLFLSRLRFTDPHHLGLGVAKTSLSSFELAL